MNNPTMSAHFLMATAALILYYTYGLYWTTIASLAMLSTFILGMKLAGKKVDPIFYLELACLVAFGLPGILFNNGLLMKLSDPVSSIIAGLAYGTGMLFMKQPVCLAMIPDSMKEKQQKFFCKVSQKAWGRVDAICMGQLLLGGAIGIAGVLLLPTGTWMILQYVSSFALTALSLAASTYVIRTTTDEPKLPPISKLKVADKKSFSAGLNRNCDTYILFNESRKTPLIFTDYQGEGKVKDESEGLTFNTFAQTYKHYPKVG